MEPRPQNNMIREDGMNLSAPDAPLKLYTLLKDNALARKNMNPGKFLDDLSDLDSLGVIDGQRQVPGLAEKIQAAGSDPLLWLETYQRTKNSVDTNNPSDIQKNLRLAHLLRMDQLNPDDDPRKQAAVKIIQEWGERYSEGEGMEAVFKRAEIHAIPFKGIDLTKQILQEEGLTPKHKVELDDKVTAFLSLPYYLDGGRQAVIAYILGKDDRVVVRSYYRSNSQGIWRYLPNYSLDQNGNIDWYAKGYGEESITIPINLQRALAHITENGKPILRVRNPDFVFAGTARPTDYIGTYFHDVTSVPKSLDGNFYSRSKEKIRPDSLTFKNPGQSPNFSRQLSSWRQDTALYGNIRVEVFPSLDGKLKFMFCRDGKNRTWIGGIEGDGEIGTTGLYSQWIKGGDLTTPAFEYRSQAGGYGGKAGQDGYVDMFERYLSKVPVIRQYLRTTKP